MTPIMAPMINASLLPLLGFGNFGIPKGYKVRMGLLSRDCGFSKMLRNINRQYCLMKPTFNAYIDGFNLYKGSLEKRPECRWLNVVNLCKSLEPDADLNTVYYFTAPVKSRFVGDRASDRQATYLRVLEHSGVKIVRGKFRKDSRWHRMASKELEEFVQPELAAHLGLTRLAIRGSWNRAQPDVPMTKVVILGEKGSDVNLASHLLRDVYRGNIDRALVITGDSDLTLPVFFAKTEGVTVHVVVPGDGQNSESLKSAANSLTRLDVELLRISQFPDSYLTPAGGNIQKPSSWARNSDTEMTRAQPFG